jgi:hypothetical protein
MDAKSQGLHTKCHGQTGIETAKILIILYCNDAKTLY